MNFSNNFVLGFAIGIIFAASLVALYPLIITHLVYVYIWFGFFWSFKVRRLALGTFIQEKVDQGYDIRKEGNRVFLVKGRRHYVLTIKSQEQK